MKHLLLVPVIALGLSACGGGGSDSSTVTPQDGNSAPVADAGVDRAVNVGEVVTLDGSLSREIDGNPLVYSWRIVSEPKPGQTYFENTDTSTPYLASIDVGEYAIELTVSDGTSASSPDTVSITVLDLAGQAPPRDLAPPETSALATFQLDWVRDRLVSPASFKLVTDPIGLHYDSIGRPGEGSVVFDFDANNRFGTALRQKAICPIKWNGNGFWAISLTSNLRVCLID